VHALASSGDSIPLSFALHLSAGTTIGYGDITPAKELARLPLFMPFGSQCRRGTTITSAAVSEGFCRVKEVVSNKDTKLEVYTGRMQEGSLV
jgi:hypothetical protein